MYAYAIVAAALICAVAGAPSVTSTPDACLQELAPRVAEMQVPEQVRKLAEDIRSLNPTLADKQPNLAKLVEDNSAELDVISAGFVKRGEEEEQLLDACVLYVENFLALMGSSSCGDRLTALVNPRNANYDALMATHKQIDEALGLSKACFAL